MTQHYWVILEFTKASVTSIADVTPEPISFVAMV